MLPRVFLALLPLLLLACVADGSTPPAGPTTPGEPPSAGPATPQPSPTPHPSGRVVLNAVGDLMLARDIIDAMKAHGWAWPFEAVRHLLADADVTIANLEGTFTDRGAAASKFYTFRTPPRHAQGLAQAGIDIVSLGNNHAMDFGAEGLRDTMAALDAVGVRHSGAGMDATEARRPVVMEANGLRLAFLSYNGAALSEAFPAGPSTPGVALAEAASIREDVAAALREADVVIVSLHAGTEYVDAPNAQQRALATAAIDAGAALVLGHHAHVLQGWQRYGSGLIVWGLGNFVFDLDFDDLETLGPRPFQTVILRLDLTREGVQEVTAVPVYIDPAPNRPVPAEDDIRRAIQQRIESLNAAFE
jgi:poly-gamma-glutamate capsule biosynthesis protein CapA/YwtB (metallophosphatase superfamily)